MLRTLGTTTLLTVFAAGSASAATLFTEDFSGLAQPSNMTHVLDGTVDYSAGDAEFTGATDRHYLRTNDLDFSTMDFVFEGTYTIPTGGADAFAIAFLGMGGGAYDEEFETPASPSIYGEIAPVGFGGGYFRANDRGAANTDSGLLGLNNGGWGGDTAHRVRLTWDAGTQQALVEVDQGYTGSFSADFSYAIDGSDNGFNSSNSQLFIGGGNGATWDDLVVIPEPSSLALLVGFGPLLLQRRRRG